MNASVDPLEEATRRAEAQAQLAETHPEPSLAQRLGQIGVLGWRVVVPLLIGLFVGRWLDRQAGTRVFFAAPLLMLGAGVGFWSLWRWMQDHDRL